MANVADFTLRQRLEDTEKQLERQRSTLAWFESWGDEVEGSRAVVRGKIAKLEAKARFLKAQLKAEGVCGGR